MKRTRDSGFELRALGRSVPSEAQAAEDFATWVRVTLRRCYPLGITTRERLRLLGDLCTAETCAAMLAEMEPIDPPPRFLAEHPRRAARIFRLVLDRLTTRQLRI